MHKHLNRIATVIAICVLTFSAATALADDWTVHVESGRTNTLDAVLSAMTADEIAALSGRRLVKTGPGVFAPEADMTAYGLTETVVQEGVYTWAGKNQLPAADGIHAVTIADGATLRVAVDLKTGTDADNVLDVSVQGSGAPGEGGAVVFTKNSSQNAVQYVNWTLEGDTVFGLDSADRIVVFSQNSNSVTSVEHTVTMNGHTLTFKGCWQDGDNGYIRFRYGPTFIAPGELVFDSVRFTRYSFGGVQVWEDAGRTAPAKFPRIRLVNGTSFNFGDKSTSGFAASVGEVACETGTRIGYNGVSSSDAPEEFTIARLSGTPTIADGSRMAVGVLGVDAHDLVAGRHIVSETNLVFAAGGAIDIDDPEGTLSPGTAYTVAEAACGFDLGQLACDDAEHPLRLFPVSSSGTALTVLCSEHTLSSDEFPVFVPGGKTLSWAEATNGLDVAALGGKKILKLGAGRLVPASDVGDSGATGLIVASGSYEAAGPADVPVNGGIDIVVKNGATFVLEQSLASFSASDRPVSFTVEGSGVGGLGAVHFAKRTDTANQWANWELTGDTVLSFASTFNFSCEGLTYSREWNRIDMNGHSLVFKGEASDIWVRFRSGPIFVNPGSLTLDGIPLSLYFAAKPIVEGDDTLSGLYLKNGAFVNFANSSGQDFASLFDAVVFESGTGIKHIAATSNDKVGPVTVKKLVGCPEISADQAVTVQSEFLVRAADLTASSGACYLDSATNLTFASGCVISIDSTDGLRFDKVGHTVARAPKGMISGRPVSSAPDVFRARVVSDSSYDYLKLFSNFGFTFVVR